MPEARSFGNNNSSLNASLDSVLSAKSTTSISDDKVALSGGQIDINFSLLSLAEGQLGDMTETLVGDQESTQDELDDSANKSELYKLLEGTTYISKSLSQGLNFCNYQLFKRQKGIIR